jgi:hypothetical protein
MRGRRRAGDKPTGFPDFFGSREPLRAGGSFSNRMIEEGLNLAVLVGNARHPPQTRERSVRLTSTRVRVASVSKCKMPKLIPVSLGIFKFSLSIRPISLRLSPSPTERVVRQQSSYGRRKTLLVS